MVFQATSMCPGVDERASSLTGCKIILTGKGWDKEYNDELMAWNKRFNGPLVNRVGASESLGEYLYAIKEARAFIGNCGGNTIMSTHFGTKTIMMWNGEYFHKRFFTSWVDLQKLNKSYFPVDVTAGDPTEEILRRL